MCKMNKYVEWKYSNIVTNKEVNYLSFTATSNHYALFVTDTQENYMKIYINSLQQLIDKK